MHLHTELVLGTEYTGVISSDDFSVYNGYPVFAQQKCLAHLRRHFKKLIQLPGLHNQAIGEAFVDLIDEAFKNYALRVSDSWLRQLQRLGQWIQIQAAFLNCSMDWLSRSYRKSTFTLFECKLYILNDINLAQRQIKSQCTKFLLDEMHYLIYQLYLTRPPNAITSVFYSPIALKNLT